MSALYEKLNKHLTFSTKFVAVNCFVISEMISFSLLSSVFALSIFIFLMPVMSLDIFSSAMRSVFCAKNGSLCRDCKLMLRVGAENVFDATILSVRRNWTEFKSWILMADSGCCCFLVVSLAPSCAVTYITMMQKIEIICLLVKIYISDKEFRKKKETWSSRMNANKMVIGDFNTKRGIEDLY